MSVTPKILTIFDIDLLREVIENCGYSYNYQTIKEYLEKENNHIFALFLENKIIAFAYGYRLTRLDGKKPMLYIHAVQVIDQYQNQGYGTILMSFIVDYIENNFSKGFLITTRDNIGACKLYEKVKGKTNKLEDVVYFFETINKDDRGMYD